MKHVSYRGQHIDMELLKFKNQHKVALGNAHLNARGDILGKGGVIIKTKEQRLKEKELEQTKPDYIPETQTKSYAPKMEQLQDLDTLSTIKSTFAGSDDFTSDTDLPASEVQEVTVTKRAPRKKAS